MDFERVKINNAEEFKAVLNKAMNHTWKIPYRGGVKEVIVGSGGMQFTFEWLNSKRTFGHCDYQNGVIRMSKALVELNYGNEYHIWDTLIHELSHAVAYEIYGYKACNHGKLWKRVNIAMGDDGVRCYPQSVKRPQGKYTLSCPRECGEKDYQLSRWNKRTEYSCKTCTKKKHGVAKWDPEFKLKVTQNW